MTDLSKFCALGVSFKDEMIAVTENVTIRVIRFFPPKKTPNPIILFVAGWITMIDSWKNVLPEMTKDFPVYYIETREKKSSVVKGQAEYSVEAIGKDIVALLAKLEIDKSDYILFGSSLGATAILDCCQHLTSSPRCLVLIGPNAEFRVPKLGMMVVKSFYPRLYLIIKPVVKWYLKNFRLDTKNDHSQYEKYCQNLDAADPWKLKKAMLALAKYQVWDVLPQVKFPTLIIGGSKDKLHEPENLMKMMSMLDNATYVDLETNEGTHSSRVVEELRKYLSGLAE